MAAAAAVAADVAAETPEANRRRQTPPRGRFEGKVIIITGAAGNFGSVAVRMFAAEGASVVLVDLEHLADRMRTLGEEVISKYGVTAKVCTVDVTKEDQVQAMVAETRRELGRIDCLFNNAGYQGLFAPVDTYCSEDFENVLKVNTIGVFFVLKHVSKVMVEQKQGAVVNTASCAGLHVPTMAPAYAASKAAVIHLTKSAAMDLAPSNVRVNSVSPGWIGPDDGYMWVRQVAHQAKANPTGAPEYYFADDPEKVVKRILESIPMRRLGTPEEVIQTVMFLLSEESSYITGVDINVSGGNVMGGSRG